MSCRHTVRLWHNARTSLRKTRVQLIGELDAMIHDLPEPLQAQLPTTVTVRARVKAVATLDTTGYTDPVVLLRLQLIEHRVAMLTKTLAQDEIAETALTTLVAQAGTTLVDLAGVAARAAAEILVETGDVRRFTEAGFARFTGTAPIPATSGEGGGQPVRHRLNRGGNRRLNAVLHRMAMIQLRRTASPSSARQRPPARSHPPRGHAHSQAAPLQRPLPNHASRHPRPRCLDMRASSASGTASATSRTTGYAYSCTAASPGTLTARHHSEPEHHAWLRRPTNPGVSVEPFAEVG